MLNQKGKLINPEIRIENTNLCNADCIICPHSSMKREQGIIDDKLYKSLIGQGKELGANFVSIFGFGEPLLDWKLAARVDCASRIGLDTFITTNGSLAHWEIVEKLFTAGLGHIRFSVHAIRKADYDKVQKGLYFNRIVTNVLAALHLRSRYISGKTVSVTVIPMNNERIEDIIYFWEGLGVDWLEIWRSHNWGTAKDYRTKTENRKRTCHRPDRGPLQIQWDGKVIPCCFLTDAEIILGDANKQTLEEILKGKAYSEFMEKHKKGDLEGLPCYDCDQLNEEQESPLLYSSRDKEKKINVTSSLKFNMEA